MPQLTARLPKSPGQTISIESLSVGIRHFGKLVKCYLKSLQKKSCMKFSKENWNPSKNENWLELNVHLCESLISDEAIIKSLINGVPNAFAPFSSFNNNGNSILFQTLNDYYENSFENGTEYIVFGSDGGGNPFCINKLNQNEILLIDFDAENIVSANNNMNEFLDSIITYKNFVDLIIGKYGEEALIENLYEEEDIEILKNNFLKINSDLLINSKFWAQQIEELIVNKNVRK